MSDRLTALGLVLDELGIPLQIEQVEQRLIIQKAVYLAQMRISLGYTYGWYLKGPYSPRLTQDYYELAERVTRGDVQDAVLKDSARDALQNVKDLIEAQPEGTRLAPWLELLASIHYLRTKSGFTVNATRKKIAETKPHLAGLFNAGVAALGA
jgi:uncharacterized protein YwgA